MTNKHCSHGIRHNNSRKNNPKIKYIPFPKPSTNEECTIRWVSLCGRSNFNVKKVSKFMESLSTGDKKAIRLHYLSFLHCIMYTTKTKAQE